MSSAEDGQHVLAPDIEISEQQGKKKRGNIQPATHICKGECIEKNIITKDKVDRKGKENVLEIAKYFIVSPVSVGRVQIGQVPLNFAFR